MGWVCERNRRRSPWPIIKENNCLSSGGSEVARRHSMLPRSSRPSRLRARVWRQPPHPAIPGLSDSIPQPERCCCWRVLRIVYNRGRREANAHDAFSQARILFNPILEERGVSYAVAQVRTRSRYSHPQRHRKCVISKQSRKTNFACWLVAAIKGHKELPDSQNLFEDWRPIFPAWLNARGFQTSMRENHARAGPSQNLNAKQLLVGPLKKKSVFSPLPTDSKHRPVPYGAIGSSRYPCAKYID